MKAFGNILQNERELKKLTISEVSSQTNIDNAIISKIETGNRNATRKQVLIFIDFYNIDEEKAFSAWLSDKILEYVKDEEYGLSALKAAESAAHYGLKPKKKATYSFEITAQLQILDELKERWADCKPLNATQLRKMREYFDVNYTYDSNQIEGNTLTYQETHLVVNEGITISGKSMREHLEAINHYEAIDFIMDIVKNKETINERLLKEVHYLILKGIDRANAGVYRSVPVFIGGSSHIPPEPYLLARKMEEIFEFYMENKNRLHPVILAADMHEKIVTIHPFIDGNGRTSRLMMNLILVNNGFTIASLKGNRGSRMEYYSALENVQVNGDSDDFYKLIIQTSINSLKNHIKLAG